MKRIVITAILVIFVVTTLAACGGSGKNIGGNEVEDIENVMEDDLAGEITVSCYNTLRYEKFLNEAATLFEREHPGTKIQIQVFSKMPEEKTMQIEDGGTVSVTVVEDDSQEIADYINRINTELMGGKGADVLAMDVLPYYKYAMSGTLEDLSLYMNTDKDFNINNYKSNIIEGTKYNGGQYIMPLDFSFRFITFDKDRIDDEAALELREKSKFTYWELTDLIKEQFENDNSGSRVIDYQDGVSQAFFYLFNGNYKRFVDIENKNVNFNDGSFVELLNKIKEQSDKGYFIPNYSSLEEEMKDYIESDRLYYYQYNTDMVLRDIFIPKENFIKTWDFKIPDIDEIAGLLTNDEGEATIRNFQAYGMNSNSQNKKLSWEFIKFMLSEEMQQSSNLLGFPVNNAAFIEKSKIDFIKTPNYVVGAGNGEITQDGYQEITDEKYVTAYEDYIGYLNDFSDNLSMFPVTDKIIDNMVTKETALFFDGSKSAEEVADVLQNKVILYLQE